MTVLVTGGAGYIGSHMVLALIEVGREVAVLDDLSTGFRGLVHPDATLVAGDCGDERSVSELMARHDIEAVVHFAGSIVVPDSVADPLGYYLNNTVKSRTLIATALKHGIKQFIFSSTAAVYGDARDNPVVEDSPLAPISPYGSSKMMTEIMLRDAARAHDFRYVALRYFNVAGADPLSRCGQATPQATHLIKVACQAAGGSRTHLDVYGGDYPTPDGTCVRDYIHVSDLARAHVDALRYLEQGGVSSVLNCGYGRGYSVLQIIEAVKRLSGVDFPVHRAGRRAGDPAVLVAGVDRIREVLRWTPQYNDIDTIVAHALAWEQKLQTLPALSDAVV